MLAMWKYGEFRELTKITKIFSSVNINQSIIKFYLARFADISSGEMFIILNLLTIWRPEISYDTVSRWYEGLIMKLSDGCFLLVYWWNVVTLFQANGHRLSLDCLEDLGIPDIKDRILDIVRKMKELKIDDNEYTCLKFLILLNPGNWVTIIFWSNLSSVLCTQKINFWLLKCCNDNLKIQINK
jgi:hypothetical protein